MKTCLHRRFFLALSEPPTPRALLDLVMTLRVIVLTMYRRIKSRLKSCQYEANFDRQDHLTLDTARQRKKLVLRSSRSIGRCCCSHRRNRRSSYQSNPCNGSARPLDTKLQRHPQLRMLGARTEWSQSSAASYFRSEQHLDLFSFGFHALNRPQTHYES